MKQALRVLPFLILGLAWGVAAWAAQEAPGEGAGGPKSLEERVTQLEAALGREAQSGKWYDRIQLSGLVDVEAGYGKVKYHDPALADETHGDVDLSKAELAADAKIHANVDGHLLFKYENDDLFVDEGYIALSGGERCGGYLIAGRQYVPFGNFETHFVTDPNTLILGETNDGAGVVGYRFFQKKLDLSAGAFNGDAQEAGQDDRVNSFVAAVKAKPLEPLFLGVSYSTNLAAANSFDDPAVLPDPENLDSLVAGWSAFLSFQFLERFRLVGEYLAALDDFAAGEIYAGDTRARKPSAWNTELGITLPQNLVLAIRYGGSDDGAAFLPQTQLGAVVNWGFYPHANLALEYLHGKFEADVITTDSVIAQLAVVF